jgi:hypothetical protein
MVIKERPKTVNIAWSKNTFSRIHMERPSPLRDCRVWMAQYTSHHVAGGGITIGGYQTSSQNCEKLLLASP